MASDKQQGFILLYVAGMLAAIAIILLQLGQMRSPTPLYMERKLTHEVQLREGLLLLDFVIAGTRQQKLPVDPRYNQYQRVLAASKSIPSEMEDQVEWLRKTLESFNFKIEGRGGAAVVEGKGNLEESRSEAASAHAVTMFQPRQESYRLKLGETEYSIRILPANALPNLNSIPFDALARYLVTLEIPESEAKELAAALIDWRDPDNFKTEGIGAEAEYYGNLQQPYTARNGPVRSWQELNYVRGMTPQRVRRFRDSFMLGSSEAARISPDYAPVDALAAMTGLKPETVKTILKEYGRLNEKGAEVSGILYSENATVFERAVSWESDATLMRIQIVSPENILIADYDAKDKRVVDWW